MNAKLEHPLSSQKIVLLEFERIGAAGQTGNEDVGKLHGVKSSLLPGNLILKLQELMLLLEDTGSVESWSYSSIRWALKLYTCHPNIVVSAAASALSRSGSVLTYCESPQGRVPRSIPCARVSGLMSARPVACFHVGVLTGVHIVPTRKWYQRCMFDATID